MARGFANSRQAVSSMDVAWKPQICTAGLLAVTRINPFGGSPDPAPRRACLLSLCAWQVEICENGAKVNPTWSGQAEADRCGLRMQHACVGQLGRGACEAPGGFSHPSCWQGRSGRSVLPSVLRLGCVVPAHTWAVCARLRCAAGALSVRHCAGGQPARALALFLC